MSDPTITAVGRIDALEADNARLRATLEYVWLYAELCCHSAKHGDDAAATEAIRNRMDAPFHASDPEARLLVTTAIGFLLTNHDDETIRLRGIIDSLAARCHAQSELLAKRAEAAVEAGRKGGKARAANLSRQRKSEIGTHAANVRWAKKSAESADRSESEAAPTPTVHELTPSPLPDEPGIL